MLEMFSFPDAATLCMLCAARKSTNKEPKISSFRHTHTRSYDGLNALNLLTDQIAGKLWELMMHLFVQCGYGQKRGKTYIVRLWERHGCILHLFLVLFKCYPKPSCLFFWTALTQRLYKSSVLLEMMCRGVIGASNGPSFQATGSSSPFLTVCLSTSTPTSCNWLEPGHIMLPQNTLLSLSAGKLWKFWIWLCGCASAWKVGFLLPKSSNIHP